jgi:hypothetical protein
MELTLQGLCGTASQACENRLIIGKFWHTLAKARRVGEVARRGRLSLKKARLCAVRDSTDGRPVAGRAKTGAVIVRRAVVAADPVSGRKTGEGGKDDVLQHIEDEVVWRLLGFYSR